MATRIEGVNEQAHSIYRAVAQAKEEIAMHISHIKTKETLQYARIIQQNLDVMLADMKERFDLPEVKERAPRE